MTASGNPACSIFEQKRPPHWRPFHFWNWDLMGQHPWGGVLACAWLVAVVNLGNGRFGYRWSIGALCGAEFPKNHVNPIHRHVAVWRGFRAVTATGALAKENQTKTYPARPRKSSPMPEDRINRMGGGGGGKGAVQLNPPAGTAGQNQIDARGGRLQLAASFNAGRFKSL